MKLIYSLPHEEIFTRFDEFDYTSHNDVFEAITKAVEIAETENLAITGRKTISWQKAVDIMLACQPIIKYGSPRGDGVLAPEPEILVYDYGSPHDDFASRGWTSSRNLIDASIRLIKPNNLTEHEKFRREVIVRHDILTVTPIETNVLPEIVTSRSGKKVFDIELDFANGRYSFVDETLTPHKPSHLAMSKLPYPYIAEVDEQYVRIVETYFEGLSLGNSERSLVLKQLLFSSLTGLNPSKKAVNLFGPAGTGKSTYLQIMKSLVEGNQKYMNTDQTNSNYVSATYADLFRDDSLERIGQARLILGFDNNDKVFISETGLFKSIVSQEPFSFSRKYRSRGTNVFHGLLVQAFNNMPQFEFGSSNQPIKDRMLLVRMVKRIRGSSNDISNFENVIAGGDRLPQLATYLINNVEAFTQFSDPDKELLLAQLDNQDAIYEFINYALDSGIRANMRVSRSLMYAMYQDWYVSYHNSQKGMLKSRNFYMKLDESMSKIGYELDTSRARVKALIRPSARHAMIETFYPTPDMGDDELKHLSRSVYEAVNTNVMTHYYAKSSPEEYQAVSDQEFERLLMNDFDGLTLSPIEITMYQVMMRFDQHNPLHIGLKSDILRHLDQDEFYEAALKCQEMK